MFERLRDEGALTVRVWQSLPHEKLPNLVAAGVESGSGDEWLRVGYLKAFMDGTLGSRTARLSDGSGIAVTEATEFAETGARATEAGFPVAVHAIGDLAVREALGGFAASADESRRHDLRHRIEHVQLLQATDVLLACA